MKFLLTFKISFTITRQAEDVEAKLPEKLDEILQQALAYEQYLIQKKEQYKQKLELLRRKLDGE